MKREPPTLASGRPPPSAGTRANAPRTRKPPCRRPLAPRRASCGNGSARLLARLPFSG